MSLLDPPVEKPQKSRAMAFTVAALGFVLILILYFAFRYYPEKRAAEHFFDALVAGDTATAYQLWKPGGKLPDEGFFGGLGTGRLLRPGEKLQNQKSHFAERRRLQRNSSADGNQSVFTDAGHQRPGEKPQDAGVERLGAEQRQVVQFPAIKVQS